MTPVYQIAEKNDSRALAEELGIPIELIGVGEKLTDRQLFSAKEFAEALF